MSYWPVLILGLLIAVPTAYVCFCLIRASRRPKVICLIYHRLASDEDYGRLKGTERVFTLPTRVFEQQVRHLKNNGYHFGSPDEVARFASGGATLPHPTVLMTFDDGCACVSDLAGPILEQHQARATIFVTTDPSSTVFDTRHQQRRRLTDEEIRTAADRCFDIGSHAVTHRPLRGLSDAELRSELVESRQELERVIGRPVETLAIPGNWYDGRVKRFARQAGYRAVWCSNPATTRTGADLYQLPRINVEGYLTIEQFEAALSTWGIVQRRVVSRIKRTPGRILGPRAWLVLRGALLRCIPGGFVSTRRILAAAGVVMVLLVAAVLIWLWGRIS